MGQARVNGKPFGTDQPFRHAMRNDRFKEMMQNITLTKTAMPVLGERRMVWDLAVQPKRQNQR